MADYLCVLFGDFTKDDGSSHRYPNLLTGVKVCHGGYYDSFYPIRNLIRDYSGNGALITKEAAQDTLCVIQASYENAKDLYNDELKMLDGVKSRLTIGDLLQDGAIETLDSLKENVEEFRCTMERWGNLVGQMEVICDLVEDGFPLTVCIG